jgi:hypothetical protein
MHYIHMSLVYTIPKFNPGSNPWLKIPVVYLRCTCTIRTALVNRSGDRCRCAIQRGIKIRPLVAASMLSRKRGCQSITMKVPYYAYIVFRSVLENPRFLNFHLWIWPRLDPVLPTCDGSQVYPG